MKETIWNHGRMEVWMETLSSRKIPFNAEHVSQYRWYGQLPKYEAQLFLAYKIGGLRFKYDCKGEFGRKYGDTDCFVEGCREPDTLDHVMYCRGYKSRYIGQGWQWEDLTSVKKVTKYLTELNSERTRRFKIPLIYQPGLKEAFKKKV